MQMRELHSSMKQKREEDLQQRVALMQVINTFCAHIEAQRDSRAIEASHEQLQSTTDAYMELEMRCDAEENELQQREFDLDMAIVGNYGTITMTHTSQYDTAQQGSMGRN